MQEPSYYEIAFMDKILRLLKTPACHTGGPQVLWGTQGHQTDNKSIPQAHPNQCPASQL